MEFIKFSKPLLTANEIDGTPASRKSMSVQQRVQPFFFCGFEKKELFCLCGGNPRCGVTVLERGRVGRSLMA